MNPKTVKDLVRDAQNLKTELAMLQIERKVKPQKDTNLMMKKRKQLAVMLTLIKQKELTVDGIHLNEKGYQVWVDYLKKYFK